MRYIFSKDHNNLTKRAEFLNAKKKYKKSIKCFQNSLKSSRLNKLASLEKQDPKLFWREIHFMLGKKQWEPQEIEPETWFTHFNSLLNTNNDNDNTFDTQFQKYVTSSMETLENVAPVNGVIDYPISKEEITKSINKLKSGKSCGPDSITNEMLKCGGDVFHDVITKLFNRVLQSGSYPTIWTKSFITPIHKSGSKSDPNNYRGISISSCVSKLFSMIINSRLETYMSDRKLISKNQNGFKKGHRTEDNIHILQTLYNKYVETKSSKLYMAFIDFRKFFDKINRQMLFYKLMGVGISGKAYNIIKSMYNSCYYHIKCNGGITTEILSSIGMKQGCNLSPSLSNIYQNDLHDIFTPDCDPVELDGYTFNSLSWADEMSLWTTEMSQCFGELLPSVGNFHESGKVHLHDYVQR